MIKFLIFGLLVAQVASQFAGHLNPCKLLEKKNEMKTLAN